MVLLGDAAHPILQSSGRRLPGPRDAVFLADQLAAHAEDVEKALASYEQARLPRTIRCQRVGRPRADIWRLTDLVSCAGSSCCKS